MYHPVDKLIVIESRERVSAMKSKLSTLAWLKLNDSNLKLNAFVIVCGLSGVYGSVLLSALQ